MATKWTTVRISEGGRARLLALAAKAETSMSEVCENLSFASVGDLLKCGQARARYEANLRNMFDAAKAGEGVPPSVQAGEGDA